METVFVEMLLQIKYITFYFSKSVSLRCIDLKQLSNDVRQKLT